MKLNPCCETMSREARLALQDKLFEFYYQSRPQLSDEELKVKVAELIVSHANEFQVLTAKTTKMDSKSIQISDEELQQTVLISGGKEGYERSGSNLSYPLWLQTQTNTYQDIFDNASPKVFYHGTNAAFEYFDDGFIHSADRITHGQNFGNAHYFTDNQKFAEGYGNIKSVLINTKNFFNASEVYDFDGDWREEELCQRDQVYLLLVEKAKAGLRGEENELQGIVSITRNMALNDKPITDSEIYRNTARHIYEQAGFDGIVFNRRDGRNEVVVYSAKDIMHVVEQTQIDKVIKLKQDQCHKTKVVLKR